MPTYYGDLADLKVASVLAAELRSLLADKASLWKHPALAFCGDQNGSGSAIRKVAYAGIGSDEMASIAENASATDTAIGTASVDIGIARHVLQRSVSDLAMLTDSTGLNIAMLAQDGFQAAANCFTRLVCDAGSAFAATAGASGAPMSVNAWFDAQFALTEAANDAAAIAVLHPKAWTQLQSSLRAETSNLIAFSPADRAKLDFYPPGYVGTFNGIDIFVSTRVPGVNAGVDYGSCMFTTGAIGYVEGTVSQIRGGNEVMTIAGTPVVTELERDASGGLSKLVHSYYCGVSILESARGVTIVSQQ